MVELQPSKLNTWVRFPSPAPALGLVETGSSGTAARLAFSYDWFLIWIIGAVGMTGLGAEILRWMNLPLAGYIVYFTHLVSIFMLFL